MPLKQDLTITEVGKMLKKADRQLVEVLEKRLELSRLVEKLKRMDREKPEPIYHEERERERLEEVRKHSEELGINPFFVQSVLYAIIGESCKVQTIQRDDALFGKVALRERQNGWYEELKRNLIILADDWAENYDTAYDENYFATRIHREYEEERLLEEALRLDERDFAIDVGCATGRATFRLAESFKRVVGFDISPAMIAKANSKLSGKEDSGISFQVTDAEKGLPFGNETASLVVMSLGTASDIKELVLVLNEARRVLKRNGILFLSFYNKNALLYQLEFVPWEVSLAAEFNVRQDWLEVHSPSGKKLSIHAKPYEVDELEGLLPKGVVLKNLFTHPTISSILPDVIFEEEQVGRTIREIDRRLAEDGYGAGAYIVAVAKKTG